MSCQSAGKVLPEEEKKKKRVKKRQREERQKWGKKGGGGRVEDWETLRPSIPGPLALSLARLERALGLMPRSIRVEVRPWLEGSQGRPKLKQYPKPPTG